MDCPNCGKRMGKFKFADGTIYSEDWWECDKCKLRLIPIADDISVSKRLKYK